MCVTGISMGGSLVQGSIMTTGNLSAQLPHELADTIKEIFTDDMSDNSESPPQAE
jgi:hypothetical protein